MKKISMILLLGILLFSFTSAVTYEQNENINFTSSCENINCSDGDIVLTIVDPAGNVIIDNQNTTKRTGYILYSLNSTQTSEMGEHQYFLSSDNDYYSSTFEITPNGEQPTTAKAFFYIGLLFLLIIFMIISIYGFVVGEQVWTRTAFLGIVYLLMIAISFVAWSMSGDFLTSSPFLISFLRIIFLALTIGFFPFLIGLFAYGVYMMTQIDEITELQAKGFSLEEAVERVQRRKR